MKSIEAYRPDTEAAKLAADNQRYANRLRRIERAYKAYEDAKIKYGALYSANADPTKSAAALRAFYENVGMWESGLRRVLEEEFGA